MPFFHHFKIAIPSDSDKEVMRAAFRECWQQLETKVFDYQGVSSAEPGICAAQSSIAKTVSTCLHFYFTETDYLIDQCPSDRREAEHRMEEILNKRQAWLLSPEGELVLANMQSVRYVLLKERSVTT